MKTPERVAVIGLGMIGGSVARGLAARGVEILGHDNNLSALDAAKAEGIVTRSLSAGLEDVSEADAVVVAVYGDQALAVLERIAPHSDDVRLITDVGSTKQTIVSAADRLGVADRFVGSHPFAGDHRSGWPASRFDLFESQTVYLCPTPASSTDSISTAQELWAALGAHTLKIDAGEHDELLAWTSHLPHFVSTALALALAENGMVRRQLGKGGHDVTRLAAGSPDVWAAIALDNSSAIDTALEGVERQVGRFRKILQSGDVSALRAQLAKAQSWSGPTDR